MKYKELLKVFLTTSLLAACTASCAPKVQVREVPMEPPASLLAECPTPPKPEGMTNGTLRDFAMASALYVIELEQELDNCNADKRALREWFMRLRGTHGD